MLFRYGSTFHLGNTNEFTSNELDSISPALFLPSLSTTLHTRRYLPEVQVGSLDTHPETTIRPNVPSHQDFPEWRAEQHEQGRLCARPYIQDPLQSLDEPLGMMVRPNARWDRDCLVCEVETGEG